MLLWMDGFDIYGSGATGRTNMLDGVYAQIGGSGSTGPSSVQVRTGTFSFLDPVNSADTGFRRIFGADKATVGFGFACWYSNLPSSNSNLVLVTFSDNANAAVASVTVTTTGQIEVRTGNGLGTVRATSAPCLVTTAWQHVEIKMTFHNTTGACEVRVNGQTVLNASNINTDAVGSGLAAQLRTGRAGVGFVHSLTAYMDDIYCWDLSGTYNNDFIGDKKVYTIFPDADTAVADWTPDTGGVGFSRINEVPPVDTSYIQAASPGDVSEFGMTDLPADVTNVLALQMYTRQLKTDAGDSNVQMSVVSGASDASGADRPLTLAATYYMDVFEEDPDTNAPWTKSGVDAVLTRATRTL